MNGLVEFRADHGDRVGCSFGAGGEPFAAVDDPVVADEPRARLELRGIRAGDIGL